VTPAGERHPDFEPGNRLAVRHGADSPSVIAERAELMRPRLFELCPWLEPVADLLAVDRFLRAEARALILHGYIASIVEDRGAAKVPVRVFEQATAADRLAAQLGNTLGLDPTGRARLKQTAASTEATLADLAAQGAQIRADRRATTDAQDITE
jgi:hypothetical protein